MKNEKIVIKSYNPYEAICPVTRVISRETLHLVKMFRAKGIEVSIEPEDGTKLSYFTKKGWQDIFTDPIVLFLAGIPLSLILNILSSWLYDNIKINSSLPKNQIPLIIEVDDNGNSIKYSHDGNLIENDVLLDIQIRMSQNNNRYKALFSKPPSFSQPFPVYLEHTNQVIGWANKLSKDSKGVLVEGIKITNASAWKRIQSGELQGLSIAGIVTSSECSICKKEYVECNHMPPNTYHGQEVSVRIDSMCLAEVSIVKEPIQPLAKIKEISFKEN